MGDESNIEAMRHSMAHIMASAIQRMWPQARFGVGPTVENGFYYDVQIDDKQISEEDLEKIEKEMKKIISEDQLFEKKTETIDEAIYWAKQNKQDYKLELLNDLKREGTTFAKDIDQRELGVESNGDSKVNEVTFYQNGDFIDLCRGPHIKSTGEAGAFKLLRISGAYWRGKESNPMMQRIYGVAFNTKDQLSEFLVNLEESKKRDHRKLGQ